MPEMDRQIVLEALSALTDRTVRPHTEVKQSHVSADELTIQNFLYAVLPGPVAPLNSLTQWMKALFLNDDQTSDLQNELFVDMEEFFDPQYDFDFRNFTDTSACTRGGEPYTRPAGWYRVALKVRDKYTDGNAWLGSVPWRSHSEAGEWPVSYHGTSVESAKGIARSHYRAGPREAYGRGIYSTPDITVADQYAMSKKFTSKRTGKTYKVIMQNRVNPQKRKIISEKSFWLVPVPEGSTAGQEQDIVENSIRPYGILIKEVA